MKKLLVVVADLNMKALIYGLLNHAYRVEGLPTVELHDIVTPRIPGDGSVRTMLEQTVRSQKHLYQHLLVLLDYEGSGYDGSASDLEVELTENLERNGWENRVCVAVIEPECDIWIWVNRNAMLNRLPPIRGKTTLDNIDQFLINKGHIFNGPKPQRPKEAFYDLCERLGYPRASNLYQKIAEYASYQQCTDRAFQKVMEYLRHWFLQV